MALFRRAATLRTMARPQQVHEALEREVKPGSMLQFDLGVRDARQFRGEVHPQGFRIVRRVQFRNSFAPILEGRVTEIDGGSQIALELFVPTSLLLFVVAWTVLAALAAMVLVQQMVLEQSVEWAMTAAMATIPLLGLCVAWLGFSIEATSSQRVLKGLWPPYVEGRGSPPVNLAPHS